jgi:hypothetical protein
MKYLMWVVALVLLGLVSGCASIPNNNSSANVPNLGIVLDPDMFTITLPGIDIDTLLAPSPGSNQWSLIDPWWLADPWVICIDTCTVPDLPGTVTDVPEPKLLLLFVLAAILIVYRRAQ